MTQHQNANARACHVAFKRNFHKQVHSTCPQGSSHNWRRGAMLDASSVESSDAPPKTRTAGKRTPIHVPSVQRASRETTSGRSLHDPSSPHKRSRQHFCISRGGKDRVHCWGTSHRWRADKRLATRSSSTCCLNLKGALEVFIAPAINAREKPKFHTVCGVRCAGDATLGSFSNRLHSRNTYT